MIIHVDMDAFYASVEERENPELKGKPLIVGGQASTRGVVAAANYAAREYGVYSAMPTITALKKCPNLLVIKPRGNLYNQVSGQIKEIFNRYTPIIEPLSLDEAFLDPKGSEKLYGSALAIGKRIKSDIKSELNLTASVGIAPNKFLAKLASDFDKPDGFTVIQSDQIQSFLDPLPVSRIWGVGKVAQKKLKSFNIHSVAEFRGHSKTFFQEQFGQFGDQLWSLCHGIDDRIVTPDSKTKSISQETTFDRDISDYDSVESSALNLTEGVGYRLRQSELLGKTVQVKIRFDDFHTITRSKSLDQYTNTTNEIWSVVKSIVAQALKNKIISIRLIGVGVSNFGVNNQTQMSIFDSQDENSGQSRKNNQLDILSDEIKKKYGKSSVKRGKSIH